MSVLILGMGLSVLDLALGCAPEPIERPLREGPRELDQDLSLIHI